MLPLTKKHEFDLVHDSQQIFRLLLDAFSHPGKTVSIAPFAGKFHDEHAAMQALSMALLDNETDFCVCCDEDCCDGELSANIPLLTLAKSSGCDAADFIFVLCKACLNAVIPMAKCGSLANPHKSATLLILNDESPTDTFIFSGPGIDGQLELPISSTVRKALTLRDERNDEYPEGIDLIFISSGGELFTIPRLVKGQVM